MRMRVEREIRPFHSGRRIVSYRCTPGAGVVTFPGPSRPQRSQLARFKVRDSGAILCPTPSYPHSRGLIVLNDGNRRPFFPPQWYTCSTLWASVSHSLVLTLRAMLISFRNAPCFETCCAGHRPGSSRSWTIVLSVFFFRPRWGAVVEAVTSTAVRILACRRA